MTRHRSKFGCFVCCSLVLLAGRPGEVTKAADPLSDANATETVVDAYTTVMTMAYPPAGGALKAAKSLMEALGFFKKPDKNAEAISALEQRLDQTERRLAELERKVEKVEAEVFRNANLQNTRELRRHRDVLQLVLQDLKKRPTDQAAKERLALQAQQVAEAFREDTRLWEWSDIALKDHKWGDQVVKAGTPLDPAFKAMPTLEVYVSALATWMTAVDYACGNNGDLIRRNYGQALQKHIDFLSVRTDWNDPEEPQTLPERLHAQVNGIYQPSGRRPDAQGICSFNEYLVDHMAREIKFVAAHEYRVTNPNSLCSVPQGLVTRATVAEQNLARDYGVEVMDLLAVELRRLKERGTVVAFDPNVHTFQILYAVNPDGTLVWRRHLMTSKAKGPTGELVILRPSAAEKSAVVGSGGSPQSGGVVTRPPGSGSTTPGKVVTRPPGDIPIKKFVTRDVAAALPQDIEVSHAWDAPKVVKDQWKGFTSVMPAGDSGIYVLTQDGAMQWYRHDGSLDGSSKWTGPVPVGSGWTIFTKIIPAGDGVIYGLYPDGILRWYRHSGFKNATGAAGEWSAMNVAEGWKFKQVFSGGEGVLYMITDDGRLLWCRHKAYLQPVELPAASAPAAKRAAWIQSWEGPKEIGVGWDSLVKAFSPGDGDIYAIRPSGELMWYKHDGWTNGSKTWRGGVPIDTGWQDVRFAFARITGASGGPIVK